MSKVKDIIEHSEETRLALLERDTAQFKEKQDAHHGKLGDINTSMGLMRLEIAEVSADIRQVRQFREEDKEVIKDLKRVVENNTNTAEQSNKLLALLMEKVEILERNFNQEKSGKSFFREKTYSAVITSLVYTVMALIGYGAFYTIQRGTPL
jgi:hypothetical protein